MLVAQACRRTLARVNAARLSIFTGNAVTDEPDRCHSEFVTETVPQTGFVHPIQSDSTHLRITPGEHTGDR